MRGDFRVSPFSYQRNDIIEYGYNPHQLMMIERLYIMENLKWISAMTERLRDELSREYDDETKDLIIRAFRHGLFEIPSIVEELKSSSLIESDYFEDLEDEE